MYKYKTYIHNVSSVNSQKTMIINVIIYKKKKLSNTIYIIDGKYGGTLLDRWFRRHLSIILLPKSGYSLSEF